MKKTILTVIALGLPLVIACQQQNDLADQNNYVSDVNGNVYQIPCLRTNASAIVTQGQAAASNCMVGNVNAPSSSDATNESETHDRALYQSNWWQHSYVVYPPYYWSNVDYNYYYYNTYNYQNYNPSNNLCSYILGASYASYNCYSNFLGFQPTNYSYYNPSCSTCLYQQYGVCQNTCWLSVQAKWCAAGYYAYCM